MSVVNVAVESKTPMCRYVCGSGSRFMVIVHAHKSQSVALQLLSGDEVRSLYTRSFSKDFDGGAAWCGGTIDMPVGTDWSIIWTLESNRGKGRIIDAVEVTSGSCQQ
jgi:hypothetical protein